jgi:sortase A
VTWVSLRRVAAGLGRTLLGLGVLILLFVAYQLWGTGWLASRSQDALRHQLSTRSVTTSPSSPGNPGSASSPTGARAAPPTPEPREGQAVGILEIPRISVDKAIVEGTGTADLRQGPGHYANTPLPGQPGNAAIAGHRTTYGAPFYDLNELRPGDRILVTTPQGTFRYDVTRSLVVGQSEVSVIAPAQTNELTLTTCTPRYSAAQRLIVQASLVSLPAAAPSAPSSPAPASTALAGGTGSWLPAVLWGVAAALVGVGVWGVARFQRNRWPAYILGTPAFLAVLFLFFVAVSKVLPASI